MPFSYHVIKKNFAVVKIHEAVGKRLPKESKIR